MSVRIQERTRYRAVVLTAPRCAELAEHTASMENQSNKVALDIERAMKHSENVNVTVRLDEVGNPVVVIKQDANLASSYFISVTNLGLGC